MTSSSYQSPDPFSRNDLDFVNKRTHDSNSYDVRNRDGTIRSRNERNGNDAVYKKALDLILMENHSLEKENEVLRKFLLLKKENCDLKTLDIITSALSMCDDKLNEFIQRMHRDKISSEEVQKNQTPDRVAAKKYKQFSPSYGASFPEVNFSELRTTYDDVQSPYTSVPRAPYPPERHVGMSLKGASPSYGQSFPELDTNELLDGPTSSVEPDRENYPPSKFCPYPVQDPLAYLDTNPYPNIQKDGSIVRSADNTIERQDRANKYSNERTQTAPRTLTKVNDISAISGWKMNSYGYQPGTPILEFENRINGEPESPNYGVKTDTRCQSAPAKQLEFETLQSRTDDEDVLKGRRRENDQANKLSTPDKEQRRSRIPRMTSTPKNKRQMSPKLSSAPATLNQSKKSSFKPIQQPHMRFSLESPRQYPRKPSPGQDKKDNKRDLEQSGRKRSIRTEPQNKSGRQDTMLDRTDTTIAKTVFYDSLEQDDNVQDTNDNFDYTNAKHNFDKVDAISRRYNTKDESIYYTPSAFAEYPPNKDRPLTTKQYKDSSTRPATGNVESNLASNPIYVSSGQRALNDYPNIAKAINARSTNYKPKIFPDQSSLNYYQKSGPYKIAVQENSQPQTYISTPEKDTGFGGDSQKTFHGSSARSSDQTERSVGNMKSYKFDNYPQYRRDPKTNRRVQHEVERWNTNKSNTPEPTKYVANDTYEITESGDDEDGACDSQGESLWVNITQRGKILNEVYEKEGYSQEKDQETLEQYPTNRSFDNGTRTTGEMEKKVVDPFMAEFSAVGSPLHTSTPVASDRFKSKRFDSARQTNASPIVNKAIGSLRKEKHEISPVERLQFGQVFPETSPVTRTDDTVKSDFAGNKEFDLSLIEAVTQREPIPGRSEKVKSVLYRPVDTLTGYSPNITADLTNTVLGSRPNRRLAGEIAFQLDRRIMGLVMGLRKQSSGNKIKRSRYYGYSLVNISQLMKKQALHLSNGNLEDAEVIERDLQIRLENIDTMLKPLRFNLAFHAEFTQDMVNKYGLMKEVPDRNTVEGFGLSEPVVLRMLLGRILGQGPVLDNILILLDCLCFLSHSDKTPLFMW